MPEKLFDSLVLLRTPESPLEAEIRERARVERQLGESKARLAGIIDSAMDTIITIDADQQIVMFNKAAEKMFRCLATQVMGQSLDRFIPPRFRSRHSKDITKFGKTGVTTRAVIAARELSGLRADGEEFPVEASISQIEIGGQKLYTVIMRDITERKQLAEQLRLQSAALKSAANTIMVTDRVGRIVWVNPAFTRTTGYTFEEAAGKNPRMLKSGEQDAGFYKDMWGTILAGKVWHNSIVNRCKDGSLINEALTITPIRNDAGVISHFVAIKQDITETTRADEARRASEVRYRRLFESAKDGILILDANSGTIVDANPFIIEMLGYSKDDLVGKELWEIGVFKDIVASKAAFVQLQEQEYIRYEYLPLETLGGVVKEVEFVSNSYLAGGIRVIQCNIRDITERRLAEAALKETNQHLEQALDELQAKTRDLTAMTQQLWQASKLATMGELAASIAHELNNPLTTVTLSVEALMTQLAGDEKQAAILETVRTESERMASLVSNLLQFSRRSHAQISTLNIADELSNSLNLIDYHLRGAGAKVVKEIAADLPTVQADRQQLLQVFLNLLTNASDAMPHGGTVTIRIQPEYLNDQPAVMIEFMDTGAGIEATDLQRIWEPFVTTKPEGKGTGLGLPICRRTIEDHRGTITIDSKVGEGTTVRIKLPATTLEVK